MAITDKKGSPPVWQCQDCKEIFSGGQVAAELANLDDVHDVFSKHRGRPLNICPKCGGQLVLKASK
jgi:hypothetical protein